MRLGTSLALIAVGAILAYAIDITVPGVKLGIVGEILLLIGVLGLLISLAMEYVARRPERPARPRVVEREPVARREPVYDPVVGGEPPTQVAPRRRGRP